MCIIGEADLFLTRLLQRFAEKSGFQVHCARTGEEFLTLAEQNRPALVVVEPELPGRLRGWEAARELQAGNQTRAIPMIVCAWLNKDQALERMGPAAAAYLQKPDLHYTDFVAALGAVGIEITPDEVDSSV